jgi:hypothetical protein
MKNYAEFTCADCPTYVPDGAVWGICTIDPAEEISHADENETLEHRYMEPGKKCWRGFREYRDACYRGLLSFVDGLPVHPLVERK